MTQQTKAQPAHSTTTAPEFRVLPRRRGRTAGHGARRIRGAALHACCWGLFVSLTVLPALPGSWKTALAGEWASVQRLLDAVYPTGNGTEDGQEERPSEVSHRNGQRGSCNPVCLRLESR